MISSSTSPCTICGAMMISKERSGSAIPGTRLLPPKRNGNRQGRSISTAVECRKDIAGLLLLGSCDRSVPRSCGWQTRQCIGCCPLAFPVPSKNPQSLRWMRVAIMSNFMLRGNDRTRRFGGFLHNVQAAKPAEASAEAAYPLGEPTILCSRRVKVS